VSELDDALAVGLLLIVMAGHIAHRGTAPPCLLHGPPFRHKAGDERAPEPAGRG
jgi:hypothetical protein